jgi:glycosyltransferase involved in cell wall biosynthesis
MTTKVLVAQLGARKHYQEPSLFHEWGLLDRFYTDFYSNDSFINRFLRHPNVYGRLPSLIKKALDRYNLSLKKAKIIHFPKFCYDFTQALKNKTFNKISESRIFCWAGKEFCQKIIRSGLGDTNVIYGFNSACLELFEYAKNRDIFCILDQVLADYSVVHKLLLEEEENWEGWSLTPFTFDEFDLELMHREQREQDLADHIVCGSDFVKDSLISRGVDSHKITAIPLGRLKDQQSIYPERENKANQVRDNELKILFVGSVGLRKGIPYLLEALREIKGKISFACKIVGSSEIHPECLAEYNDVCDFMGRIPRSQIKDLYAWADVFVLPSICEGSAMVIYEALSLGLPVITTYNSGSIVRDGIDGFIVPIRDTNAIAEKLIKIHAEPNFFNVEDIKNHLSETIEESKCKLKKIVSIE